MGDGQYHAAAPAMRTPRVDFKRNVGYGAADGRLAYVSAWLRIAGSHDLPVPATFIPFEEHIP